MINTTFTGLNWKNGSRRLAAWLAGAMLASSGVALAVPTCNPTYTVDTINDQATIIANCTPGAGETIDAATGYNWLPGGHGTTSQIVVSPILTYSGTTFSVQAKAPQGGYGSLATVTLYAGPPQPCDLAIQKSDGSLGTTESISLGSSATLIPTCHGATDLIWHSSVSPYSSDSTIPAPSGGAVIPSATTKYFVVGWNDYGDSRSNDVTVTVGPPPAPVPVCSLSANPSSLSTGGSTTLTANCPGATTFHWTGNGVASAATSGNTVGATPSGTGSFNYTVAGENSSGTGDAAGTSVNVSALPLSACSAINPSALSVTLGSPSGSMSATCNNNATSYVWKLDGATVGTCTVQTCNIPAASLSNLGTYGVTVTANNAGGTGTQAANATITVSSQPLSVCSSINPSTQTVTTGDASATMTATCNNNATSYVWKLDGVTIGGCSGNSCFLPAASLPTAGSYGVTVTANNAGGTGTSAASATITVEDPAAGPAGCGPTPVGTIIDTTHFTWAAGNATVQITESLTQTQTLAAKFHTPAVGGNSGGFGTVPTSTDPSADRYMTISTCPGDFTVTTNRCWADGNSTSANINFQVGGSNNLKCVLQPDTDYYMNVGHLTPTSVRPRVYDSFVNTCTSRRACVFWLGYGHD